MSQNSPYNLTLSMAASRLRLQDPSALEGDAAAASSSRNELAARQYLPHYNMRHIDRVE